MNGQPPPLHSTRLWPFWLAWTVFVVYGSLVPLDYHPLPFDAAWQRLLQAPMLRLGVGSRADWVANGVLYLPVGFLTTGMLMGSRPGALRKLAAAGLGVGFGILLAVSVELAQTAFPPRTVSRNDLLAEAIGSVLGMLAALAGAGALRRLLSSFGKGGWYLRRLLAPAYLLAFVAWSLFPFDLLLGADEWAAKMQRGHVAWLLVVADGSQGIVRPVAKLLIEVLAAAPLGAWWASRQAAGAAGAARRPDVGGRGLLLGALLGLAIELTQLFIASGISQGVSVLTRVLGFAAGVAAWHRSADVHVEALRALLRRASSVVLLVYLPLLTAQFGWWHGPWLGIDRAAQRLEHEVRFVPLYYHYYTSEASALVSLVAAVSSYAPAGLLGWAWHLGPGTSAWLTGLLSLLIESGRLMAEDTKPDPSNVLIAAAAAWLTHRLADALARAPGRPRPLSP